MKKEMKPGHKNKNKKSEARRRCYYNESRRSRDGLCLLMTL